MLRTTVSEAVEAAVADEAARFSVHSGLRKRSGCMTDSAASTARREPQSQRLPKAAAAAAAAKAAAVKPAGRSVDTEALHRPITSHSSPSQPATNTSSSKAARQSVGTASVPVSNRYALLEEDESTACGPADSSTAAASAAVSTTVSEQLLSASRQASTKSTIVARGQVEGVQCVDMLIDTGASCCFVRRSWAEGSALPVVPLKQHVTVIMADRRTAVSTHEVRAGCVSVHGSEAACTLLVMDELSNDVIVGLSWQRAARLAITPGYPHDLLNGRPVHDAKATIGPKQPGTKPLLLVPTYDALDGPLARGTRARCDRTEAEQRHCGETARG